MGRAIQGAAALLSSYCFRGTVPGVKCVKQGMNLYRARIGIGILRTAMGSLLVLFAALSSLGQNAPDGNPGPIPGIRQLMTEVMDHQKQLEKVRENYTFHSSTTTQSIDSGGKVTKTESEDSEVFYVNTHRIERTVKKDGKALNDHDQQKEQERVTKLVEKAQKVPPGEPLEGPNTNISVSHLLDIMEASNPRRVVFRGRSTIVFDFAGRRDAKTHGLAEDASKKIAGTIWIDERDRQVARMEAHFIDNFHVAGGLLANVQKGSSFFFDQAQVNGEIWFPTAGEGNIQARVLLLKSVRQHVIERDFDYQRFTVETQTSKTATVVPAEKK
jgi:hypothetical protein